MKRIFMSSFALVMVLISGCKFLEAPSMAMAKEMCSCLFVSKMDEDYCRSITKEARFMAGYQIDWTQKKVSADGNDYEVLAVYNQSRPRLGCQISKVEHSPEFPEGPSGR